MQISKSKRINEALLSMGISNEVSLVNHLPRNYADFTPTEIGTLENKTRLVIYGKIMGSLSFVRARKITIVSFSFMLETGRVFKVTAFNRPYLYRNLVVGDYYTVVGSYDAKKGTVNLVNIVKGSMSSEEMLKPIYSLPTEIENYQFHNYVNKILDNMPFLIENFIPSEFVQKYRLLSRLEALKLVHNPKKREDIYQGLRTLKYEECLLFSLQTQMIRLENKVNAVKNKKTIDVKALDRFINSLPYKLTNDQITAVNEIIGDMNQSNLMYRLLQGDVGTGKTLVASLAMYGAVIRQEQAAIMAPTDALARQHYESLSNLFKDLDVKIVMLVGSLKSKERELIKKLILSGEAHIIIGTHALFSSDIIYKQLGLVVIDEQHRFGVNQRLLLSAKGEQADLLLMSATPIPRTLSLTLFGDLDISTLTNFPQGKRDVVTKIVTDKDQEILDSIKESLKNHKRVFIIAPLIEYGETRVSVESLYLKYSPIFKNQISLLHGKIEDDAKVEILESFKSGEKPILIATTIIEVGIDIKNANLMIVYDAPNFGLASLHQIRGRIGRDGSKAKCLLVHQEDAEEIEKLKVLENSLDGFEIAEMDLKLRGPGELSGMKQSGLPNFHYVNIIDDFKIFEVARNDAKKILENNTNGDYALALRRALHLTKESKFTNV